MGFGSSDETWGIWDRNIHHLQAPIAAREISESAYDREIGGITKRRQLHATYQGGQQWIGDIDDLKAGVVHDKCVAALDRNVPCVPQPVNTGHELRRCRI
jgi:hypothetical protein